MAIGRTSLPLGVHLVPGLASVDKERTINRGNASSATPACNFDAGRRGPNSLVTAQLGARWRAMCTRITFCLNRPGFHRDSRY